MGQIGLQTVSVTARQRPGYAQAARRRDIPAAGNSPHVGGLINWLATSRIRQGRPLKQLLSRFKSLLVGQKLDTSRGVVVYTEPGCACSASAIELLRDEGVEPSIVMLEDHPDVRREHGAATPIVSIDGRVRFFGRVDAVLLKRILKHRRRQE
ncbi:MAG: glutaredoxin domain-containing protein [Planctomycetota bacterium]